jgi:hypothetical protein
MYKWCMQRREVCTCSRSGVVIGEVVGMAFISSCWFICIGIANKLYSPEMKGDYLYMLVYGIR